MAKKAGKYKAPDRAGAATTESSRAPRASGATVAPADQAQSPGPAGAIVAPAAGEGGASLPSGPRTGEESAAAVGAGAAPSEQISNQAGDLCVAPACEEGGAVNVAPAPPSASEFVQPPGPSAPAPPAGELVLIVRTKGKGTRRRAGRAFGPEEATIPLGVLTEAELEAIDGDPELISRVTTAG